MTPSHRDYEPFEMAENMEEDLGLFEAATQARRLELDLGPVAKILRVTDGSNQDATALRLGHQLARHLSATVTESAAHGSSLEILAAAKSEEADLVIVPVPCGEDISNLQSQSLGSVTDGLLQSSPVPLLCVRDPLPDVAIPQVFNSILVAVARDDRPSEDAVAWALRLAGKSGRVVLLELADRGSLEEAQLLLQGRQEDRSVQDAVIGRAVASRLGSLIGAVQRHANRLSLSVQVEFRLGNPVREILAAAETLPHGIIILARAADHTSAGYHLAEDLLLATRRTVLVI